MTRPQAVPASVPDDGPLVAGVQEAANARLWSRSDLVGQYASRQLRPVEVMLMIRHRDALLGRVLELGPGAGRVTGYLAALAARVDALEVNPGMAAACRELYPRARVRVGDLRDLSPFASGCYDAIFAGVNVIDVLADEDRGAALDEFRRLLAPGGRLIFSTHNLAHAPQIRGPVRDVLADPVRRLPQVPRLPLALRNRRRMRALERVESDYAILNDVSHDFQALHYYIGRDEQERQLAAHGLELTECLDLDGALVPVGDGRPDCAELHYVARRAG
jgi:SAM-dependent methyltransferase